MTPWKLGRSRVDWLRPFRVRQKKPRWARAGPEQRAGTHASMGDEEKVTHIGVVIIADLTHLVAEEFWYVMDHRDWVHPYAFGKRYDYSDLPKSIDKSEDDPFCSLAGELRRAGGFSEDNSPFSGFLWANRLRHRMDRKNVERDFEVRKSATR